MAVKAKATITLVKQVDVSSVVPYYLAQTSTLSPPTFSASTISNWSTTQPALDTTKNCYIAFLNVFSDGTYGYSDVSLMSEYEAGKVAYNRANQAFEATQPIASKTFSGIIGTDDNAADGSLYFAKVHPTSYAASWRVKLHIAVTAPAAYSQIIDIDIRGDNSSFRAYDALVSRNSSLALYYINLYRAKSAGITNGKGHALGFGLRNSTNPTTAANARTISVDVMEVENCTVAFLDTAVKYASMDGTGSTNYDGLTELGVASNGQNATNNSNTSYTQFGSAVKAGAYGVKRYTLLMRQTADTWSSFIDTANSVATTKGVSTSGYMLGKLLYSAGGTEYSSGSNTSTVYDCYPFDFRYSSNCAKTLTAYKPVYLVGTIGNDGLFYFDTTTWWTQTIPTTADGKTYIYVGDAYSTYQVWLATENPAYRYYEGAFRTLDEIETMESAKVATNYITKIGDDGIKVHAGENADANYVQINSNGMDLFSLGGSVAHYGTDTRIGPVNGAAKITIENDEFDVWASDNSTVFHVSTPESGEVIAKDVEEDIYDYSTEVVVISNTPNITTTNNVTIRQEEFYCPNIGYVTAGEAFTLVFGVCANVKNYSDGYTGGGGISALFQHAQVRTDIGFGFTKATSGTRTVSKVCTLKPEYWGGSDWAESQGVSITVSVTYNASNNLISYTMLGKKNSSNDSKEYYGVGFETAIRYTDYNAVLPETEINSDIYLNCGFFGISHDTLGPGVGNTYVGNSLYFLSYGYDTGDELYDALADLGWDDFVSDGGVIKDE